MTAAGVRVAGRRMLVTAISAGAALYTLFAIGIWSHHHWLYDFKGGLYNAGQAILNGHNPYHGGFIARQAAIMRAGGMAIGETSAHSFSLPVYPAPANLAVIPFSLLPYPVAGVLFTLLSIGAMGLALWLLEVRDWRCYALAAVSWPFAYGVELGAVGPLLVLGVAVMWRWRERLWPPALALASIVVVKIFPFPLAAWLLITRRYRALALTVAVAGAVTLLAWALLGFAGLTEYPRMLANASFVQEGRSDSLAAVLLAAGLSSGTAQMLSLASAAALVGLAWWVYRSGEGARAAFGLLVIAALTASPIVWDHYLVLLFVPIALLAPRYSSLWLIPLLGPLLLVASAAFVPFVHAPAGSSVNTIRDAWLTLGFEAILAFRLCRGAAVVRLPRLAHARA
jgi:hypothetical protein